MLPLQTTIRSRIHKRLHHFRRIQRVIRRVGIRQKMLANIHGVPHRPTGVDSRDILHVVDTPKIGIPGSGIHNCVADGPPVAFAPTSTHDKRCRSTPQPVTRQPIPSQHHITQSLINGSGPAQNQLDWSTMASAITHRNAPQTTLVNGKRVQSPHRSNGFLRYANCFLRWFTATIAPAMAAKTTSAPKIIVLRSHGVWVAYCHQLEAT